MATVNLSDYKPLNISMPMNIQSALLFLSGTTLSLTTFETALWTH